MLFAVGAVGPEERRTAGRQVLADRVAACAELVNAATINRNHLVRPKRQKAQLHRGVAIPVAIVNGDFVNRNYDWVSAVRKHRVVTRLQHRRIRHELATLREISPLSGYLGYEHSIRLCADHGDSKGEE